MDSKLQPSLSISDHPASSSSNTASTMTMDKENSETLNVEVEQEDDAKETKSSNRGSAKKQLYVQVKRRRVKRQYRRNQDAINFLRRFTLAVVIIDLILSISESTLMSTFFLFVTLSTTFDVKPENVIDTYCYYYQGGGTSMCEHYMERVTGYSTPSSTMNQHHGSSSTSSSPSENHFPTVASRPPLTPSESRKLFLTYNQSLYEHPARFSLVDKIGKDSKLSRYYSRLIYLLFENKNGILNENRSISEFLKDERSFFHNDQATTSTTSNLTDTTTLNSLLHSSISERLMQSIEVISPHASSLSLNKANHLLFFLCSKTLEKLRATQRIKQKRLLKDTDNNKLSSNSPTGDPSLGNPIRKNLIQATDFVRHRWKRDATTMVTPTGKYEKEHGKIPAATGSNNASALVEKAGNDDDDSGQEQGQGKETQEISPVSAPSTSTTTITTTQQPTRVTGYRLIKGQNNYHVRKDSVTKATISRRDVSHHPVDPPPSEMSSFLNQSREFCKNDIEMMIFTMSKENLNALLKNNKSHVNLNKSDGGGKQKRNNNNKEKNVGGMKYLEELLFLELAKSPRHILSLMEISLFSNWHQFAEISKRLSLHYIVDDNGLPKDDRDEYLIWSSIREEIMEKFVLNMETDIFSQETYRKAERRKRAVEQMYHDYSFTILEELKNVRDMPLSQTFYGIHWVIRLYVLTWQTSICMVLFFGSVFEDKTALNIWGIFNILTSLVHFMVDDWINTTFQPKKTSASIWFGVIYGVYKPITILLVATLSSEIFKNDGTDKKGLIARVREIIRGRKRPSLIGEKCLGKLKGLFITSESLIEKEGDAAAGGGGGGSGGMDKTGTATSTTSKEKSNGNIVYKGIRAVKIRAKIKRMEMNNGNLIVITQTVTSSSGMKNAERSCLVCGNPGKSKEDGSGNDDAEKIHEGYLVYPSSSSPHDNEAGMVVEDLYPEETDDEEEDEDELEEVVDEDDDDDDEDESDEEDDRDNEECSHPDHDFIMRQSQRPRAAAAPPALASNDNAATGGVMTGEKKPADIAMLSETGNSGGIAGCGGGRKNNGRHGLSFIAYTGNNGLQGNLLHDSNTRAPSNGQQGYDLQHGPIVDGGNLHI